MPAKISDGGVQGLKGFVDLWLLSMEESCRPEAGLRQHLPQLNLRANLSDTLETRCHTQAGRERRSTFDRSLLYTIGFELCSTVIEVISVI